MTETVTIKAHCASVISLARVNNGLKIVDRIIIKNTSGTLLTGLVLSIESDPVVIYPKTIQVGDIKKGGSITLDDIQIDLSTEYISELTELQKGVIRLTVSTSDKEFTAVTSSHDITILPYDQWEGVSKTDELLASFSVPNHPDVKQIIQEASSKMQTWTGNPAMDGYAGGDRERVKLQAAAIFDVIKSKSISYTLPPAGFYESGQRIRMPEEILSTRLATCMDTTMLYASCLESVRLRPLVILNRTHAYTGLWLDTESTSPCAVNDDPTILRKRNAGGINQMLAVETTFMDKGSCFTFDNACRNAEMCLANTDEFECYVDIHEARKLGVTPLPLRVRTPDGYMIIPSEPTDDHVRPDSLPTTDVIDLDAPAIVDKQIIWERKLLDLTLRNNLINIHPRTIMQIMDPDVQMLVSAMENGRSMRIGCAPEGWAGSSSASGVYSTIPAADKMAAYADEEVKDGRLHSYLENSDLIDRMESLRHAAKRSIEENGANSLYLAIGTLKWIDNDRGKEHFAPIILLPCEIIRQGGSIVATGEEPVCNLTLLEMLRENFGINIPGMVTLPQKGGHTDVRLVLNTVRKAVMEVKGWDVDPLVFLGNFTFSKFIIWNDLHEGKEVFGRHPIVDGFKNGILSKDAAVDMSTMPYADDCCQPERILLPLGADSSQIKAIRDAIDGKSFVMQGPPGTGKSQTITNIIANSLYHGKRVLFVSEKKAALDVVQKRLEAIGLGPFCLELHSNKATKSLVLSKMEATLGLTGAEKNGDFSTDARNVARLRSELNGHVQSLHDSTETGMTLYDAVSQYLSSGKEIPCRRLPNAALKSLSPDKIRHMQSAMKDFSDAAERVPLEGIRGLLDLPLSEYTPAFADTLNQEMKRLLAIRNPILFRFSSRKLARMLGIRSWDIMGLGPASDRKKKIAQWHDGMDGIRDYAIYNSRRNILRSLGLGPLASEYEEGALKASSMPEFLTKSLCHEIAKERIGRDGHLSTFCGDLFENKLTDYRRAEQTFSESSRNEIIGRMQERISSLSSDISNPELTILKKAMHNGARGISLRSLFSKIPSVLPRICPCMLMSPLSVSQYLTAEADMFDIVIFDEASQMQTCEAIASIGRGKSLIVAGDSKQLPPTTFFETMSFDMDNAEQEDMESVLEDCLAISIPANTLRWHYRSRHESLIAFSNSKYYDNSLLTFPSPDDLTSKVTLEKVNGLYERGGTRQNKKEADAIVAEIKRRLEESTDKSLGVITFSQPQQVAVEKRLEAMFRQNPGLEQIAASMEEPIFVKNLENVQGDERDVILFSVGYGPDKDGQMPMNFGPLNQQGGWRRLNVAVSRARYEMKVFSSISPWDIRVDYNTPLGVVGLRDFIQYAEVGRSSLLNRTDSDNRSDRWVEKLAQDLRDKGLKVNTNVGSSDFKVDIAVMDKDNEGIYSTGIVCDGLNYANADSAVDREIVRPAMLESLGWKIERRWILDEWMEE